VTVLREESRERTVVLYSRPGCHLCDEAREALEAMRGDGWRFELRELDIEMDPRLHSAYLERIPVVEVDGEVVSELWLDRGALEARLDTVLAMGPRQSSDDG
jgi:glutaredoxin